MQTIKIELPIDAAIRLHENLDGLRDEGPVGAGRQSESLSLLLKLLRDAIWAARLAP